MFRWQWSMRRSCNVNDKCQITIIFHNTYRLVLQVIYYINLQFEINIVYNSKLCKKAIVSIFYTSYRFLKMTTPMWSKTNTCTRNQAS